MGNLCLSRYVGESIVIIAPGGQRVEIILTEMRGNKARLAICAPGDVGIWRSELLVNGEPPAPSAAKVREE